MLSFGEAIESGAIGLGLSLAGTYLYSRRKGAEALDIQLQEDLDKARQSITELSKPKPTRTNAEQYRYDEAKAAIVRIEEPGVRMLIHLQKHGALKFNGFTPPLPTGFGKQSAISALEHCVKLGLVTPETTSRPSGGVQPIVETTYRIAPGMQGVLDELLYLPEHS